MKITDLAGALCEALQQSAGAGGNGAEQWDAVAREAVRRLGSVMPVGQTLAVYADSGEVVVLVPRSEGG